MKTYESAFGYGKIVVPQEPIRFGEQIFRVHAIECLSSGSHCENAFVGRHVEPREDYKEAFRCETISALAQSMLDYYLLIYGESPKMSTFENTIITIETFLDKEFSSVETSGSTTGMAHILQNVCQGTNQESTIHKILTSK